MQVVSGSVKKEMTSQFRRVATGLTGFSHSPEVRARPWVGPEQCWLTGLLSQCPVSTPASLPRCSKVFWETSHYPRNKSNTTARPLRCARSWVQHRVSWPPCPPRAQSQAVLVLPETWALGHMLVGSCLWAHCSFSLCHMGSLFPYLPAINPLLQQPGIREYK